MKKAFSSVCLVCLLLWHAIAFGFSGTISDDTVWSGAVFIDGDVTVLPGAVLTIMPGTQVIFAPKASPQDKGIEFTILGILIARGEAGEGEIFFTSGALEKKMADWQGIVFKKNATNSILAYCTIEYAYNGLTCLDSAPDILDCVIRYHYNAGIYCRYNAKPRLRETQIMQNGLIGIHCGPGSQPVIEQCLITENGYGISIEKHAHPDLGRINPLRGQSTGKNRFMTNFDANIYNRSDKPIYAQNNYWQQSLERDDAASIINNLADPQNVTIIITPAMDSSAAFADAPTGLETGLTVQNKSHRQAENPKPATPKKTPSKKIISDKTSPPKPQKTPVVKTKSKPLAANNTQASKAQAEKRLRTDDAEKMPEVLSQKIFATMDSTPPFPAQVPKAIADDGTQPIREPVLESMLDSGQREYLFKTTAEYPRVYLKTGVEGIVLAEVTVGRDGRILKERVLKSDGDLFSEAALSALKKYRYKTGFVNGKPVQFNVLERFTFTLGKR